MRLLRAILVGLSGLIAVGCGDGGVQSPDFTPELQSVRVEPLTADVPAGRTFQFRAFGTYTLPPGSATDTEEREITGGVDWSVSNGNATIDENGLAEGVVENTTAEISAELDGVTAENPAVLTIGDAVVESLRIVEGDQTIPVDGFFDFSAEGTFSNGDVRLVTVSWSPASSSNTTLTPASGETTRVSGVSSLAPGFTVITATLVVDEDTTLTDTVQVTVRPLVTGLSITPANPSRPLGLAVDFEVTATCKTAPATTGPCATAPSVTWSVANSVPPETAGTSAVANIDATTGVANSLRVGTAVVTASADGVTATTNFVVTSPVVSRIEIVSPSADTVPLQSATTPVGLRVPLRAIAIFTNNTRTAQRATWTLPNSTPPGVVSFFGANPNADIQAEGEVVGSGTVQAGAVDEAGNPINGIDPNGVTTGSQITDTVPISVTNAVIVPSTFRVVPATDSVTVGRTRTFQAVVDDSNGNTVILGSADVSWAVTSAGGYAVIDDPAVGVVRGVAVSPTPVTITATGVAGGLVAGLMRTATLRVTDNVCTTPLSTADGATAETFFTPTCIGCGIEDPDNAAESVNFITYPDITDFTRMHVDLALLNGEATLRAQTTGSFPGGDNVGFVIARPVGELVLAELFSQLQVRTVLADSVQEAAGGPTPPPGGPIPLPLRVDLLGTSVNGAYELALVSLKTNTPYDAIELGFNSGVVTALSNVLVFQACGTAEPPQTANLQSVAGIEPAASTLLVGGSRDFVLMGVYSDGSTAPIPDADVTWQSLSIGVATIAANGLVQGVGAGTATISATLKPGVPITTAPSGPATTTVTVVADVCTAPLLTSSSPAATVTSTINGICILCGITNLPNVIDPPQSNFATMNVPVGLLNGGGSVIVNANTPITPTAGNVAGFVISRPISPLVQAEVLSQVLVETLDANNVVVNSSGPVIPLRLGLLGMELGGGEQLFVGVPTTGAPFSKMRITLNSGLLTADLDQLGNVNVFRACAATVVPATD